MNDAAKACAYNAPGLHGGALAEIRDVPRGKRPGRAGRPAARFGMASASCVQTAATCRNHIGRRSGAPPPRRAASGPNAQTPASCTLRQAPPLPIRRKTFGPRRLGRITGPPRRPARGCVRIWSAAPDFAPVPPRRRMPAAFTVCFAGGRRPGNRCPCMRKTWTAGGTNLRGPSAPTRRGSGS